MATYKIGITEAGDASADMTWTSKMNEVDGAVLITKNITPQFMEAVMNFRDKVIVHATITGYGGTIVEPNVPKANDAIDAAYALANMGLPRERIVIRVDPIIPTQKGIKKACNVIRESMMKLFSRFRVSVIDMYPHVQTRFKNMGLPLPYGEGVFAPSQQQLAEVDSWLKSAAVYYDYLWGGTPFAPLRIEACAEPGLKYPIHTGCISEYDLALLGLEDADISFKGRQRPGCLCYDGKVELLNSRHPCKHGCAYCYWKTPME